ncbi:DUF4369 domain-containing protein [Seonamhaeicola aphaedonensis]|uniref:Uncharacterized protein DUF4369 n=1 Tax=Seonamhaeicola aphaedonensis TaxID=1461338 RepID=A0A3D9HFJ5_9FLAO|nr:DUF4369 domain-containing protein [Seonamhaeicola aphaedonensis]RED48258.1 uncharacterized protein DUF4369 [Seonamhaeicola aphaedonensis]
MKKIIFILLVLFIAACGKKERNLVVKAHVKGLKKGTVYLKKVIDTNLVTVDSVIINGNSQFELYSDVESPEVFYLYLDKNSKEDDRITFFADKGVTEINTSLKTFAFEPKINGSEQQKVLEDYLKMESRFNNENLELIKASLEAQKDGDTTKLYATKKDMDNLLKRKYLYTVNFALNHNDSEVAPYLALTEIYDARLNLLDTINNSLTTKVKGSKYGKQLDEFVTKIKAQKQ